MNCYVCNLSRDLSRSLKFLIPTTSDPDALHSSTSSLPVSLHVAYSPLFQR